MKLLLSFLLLLTTYGSLVAQRTLYQSLINQHDIADEFKGPISNEMADNLCRYSLPKAYYDQDYITWAIKEKKTGLIIGMRDLYTDSPD
jgi:hypothetical protein